MPDSLSQNRSHDEAPGPKRPVPAPSFQLLPEGDVPDLHFGREGYLPDPELLSIMDAKPHPETPDYWKVLAAVIAALLLAIAVRVITYYAVGRPNLDSTPLEARARYSAPAAPSPSSEPSDDTIYYADSGVTLPVLRSKFEPPADAPGKITLLAVIDPSGKPVNARVWHGLDADLNARAILAAGKWRFRPGTKDGRPVPVLAQLEVNFRRP